MCRKWRWPHGDSPLESSGGLGTEESTQEEGEGLHRRREDREGLPAAGSQACWTKNSSYHQEVSKTEAGSLKWKRPSWPPGQST